MKFKHHGIGLTANTAWMCGKVFKYIVSGILAVMLVIISYILFLPVLVLVIPIGRPDRSTGLTDCMTLSSQSILPSEIFNWLRWRPTLGTNLFFHESISIGL
jgi:hypothetical protein